MDYAFSVDVLEPQPHEPDFESTLPAGWFVKDGMLHLEPIHDWWELKRGSLVRHHVLARNEKFRPDETGDCPLPLHFLSKDRTTETGKHKHSDRWRRVNHNHSATYWTGRTIFKVNQKDRRDAEASFYQASEGQSTYAGTKTKLAKDAKSFDEKTLSLADRVTFMEAKRKELESFFTNNVWEFSHLDEAPPERVLKAHFILKWSKHPDGSPRAKARLITQGFRDPDALAGTISTTSPTLSRLGRTCLMSVAANQGWTNFIADITTAFLQGQPHSDSRVLWIRLPSDARRLLGIDNPRVCMRLKKSIYGFCDAPRSWYLEAIRRFESIGFVRHPLDNCLLLYFALPRDQNENDLDDSLDGENHSYQGRQKKTLVCALGLHVDDILGAGDAAHPDFQTLKQKLQENFSFRDFREDQDNFEFLGARVDKLPEGGFSYTHSDYIAKIKPISIGAARMADPNAPVSDSTPHSCGGITVGRDTNVPSPASAHIDAGRLHPGRNRADSGRRQQGSPLCQAQQRRWPGVCASRSRPRHDSRDLYGRCFRLPPRQRKPRRLHHCTGTSFSA